MTTPGGVPNLPVGALTAANLESRTQDMTPTAMKSRASERFPSIFGGSSGGDAALDISPFGILTSIWASFNSSIATADPNDIQGPEDLPELIVQFITGLPLAALGWVRSALERLASLFGIDLDGLLDEGFDAADAIGAFIESIIDGIIDAVEEATGLNLTFLHNLVEGFSETGTIIEQLYDALTGRGPTGTIEDLATWASDLPLVGDIFRAVTGELGDGSLLDIGSWFTGLTGLLGNPLGLLTGSATVPGLSGIPLLGGLFGGGGGLSFLTGLIPGLDASKITTGSLSLGQLPGTVLSTVSGVASSLLSGVLGSSLIPGLDASKITTGSFSLAQLPATVLTTISGVASSLLSGTIGSSLIPGLDASKITSGSFSLAQLPATVLSTVSGVAASLLSGVLSTANIPGLDASKITTGTFAQSMVTGLVSALASVNSLIQSALNGLTKTVGTTFTAATAAGAAAATSTAASTAAATAAATSQYLAAAQATANVGASLNGIVRAFLFR